MAEQHRGGSGNFAEDREKASEAGRKGGQHSGGYLKNGAPPARARGKQRGQSSPGGWRKSCYGFCYLNLL
ncbi:general stress protein [Enterobacter hormaechei]